MTKKDNGNVSRFTFYTLRITHYAFLSLLICLPHAFGQESTGKIEGQIIDRQKNQPLAQHPVILKIHQGEAVNQRETVTDTNGTYKFDELPIAFDTYYTVSTTYDGQEHLEDDLVLSAWVSQLKVNIELGGLTDDRSKVKVRQHTIVITPPPANHAPDGAVSVMEIIQVENTSDVEFQAVIDGNQAGLAFNLPPGYEALKLDQIFQQELTANNQQLTSSQPLPPGKASLGFSYVIHVGESGLNLSRPLTFDTDQLYLFISDGMPLQPQSRILGAGRQEQIHDMSYTIYATNPGNPLSNGQTADLRFAVASVSSTSQRQGGGFPTQAPNNPLMLALIAIAAACAGGFFVAAIIKIRSTTVAPAESESAPAVPDAGWLNKLDVADLERIRVARLEMITRLEELHEKKEISERVYNRLRKEQADRLAVVLERLQRP